MPSEEHELLELAKTGDYDAFEQLHALLEPQISRFVRRLVGYGPQAEDVVQETFISLFTHMERIDPVENLRPYLFRIARNQSYDHLRRQGRFDQLSLDDEPTQVRVSFDLADGPAHSKPEDVTHWLLLYMEVREAMERLPELQRQTLILFSEESMTYAEIAEVMEVSVGTVKSRLFHAKRKLRGLVREETLDAISTTDAPPAKATPRAENDTETTPETALQSI